MLRTCFAAASSTLFLILAACTGGPGGPLTQQHQSQSQGGDDDDIQEQIARAQQEQQNQVAAASATAAQQSISASSYKQDCTQDSDCAAVYEGQLCGNACTSCSNAAIASTDVINYSIAKANGQIACAAAGGSTGSEKKACGDCANPKAVCDQGSKKCKTG